MGAVLSFAPVGASQQLVQNRALIAVEDAVEFRRNRVSVSRAEIAPVQWAVIVVISGMILATLAAIHINARWAMAFAMFVFSTAVAMCVVLLMVYDSVRFRRLHIAADHLSRGDARLTAQRRS